jgi:dolichol-phosphate mannosyltransferase
MYSTSKPHLRRQVAIVIPCYRVRSHILDVLRGIGDIADTVYCIDDNCPERSGDFIEKNSPDPRVRVIRHDENQGVGGATLTGYRAALRDGADIIVKIDGDGQMDTDLVELFIAPIAEGNADYTKGNRFHSFEDTRGMPRLRLFGNACLSFMTKLSSGYWNIFDPTNGYTAIERTLAERVIREPVARRYFFESDMLFHLYLDGAVVIDVPIPSRYGDEVSNLKVRRVFWSFAIRNLRNMFRRIILHHYMRDFSLASLEFLFGLIALTFGVSFGVVRWIHSTLTGEPATAGTVMLSAMPILVGVQLCLSAINYDIQSVPRIPRHPQLRVLAARIQRTAISSGGSKASGKQAAYERAE